MITVLLADIISAKTISPIILPTHQYLKPDSLSYSPTESNDRKLVTQTFSKCYNVPIMANCDDLKRISEARLKTAEILINAQDWEGAAYMMGYVLECALKAVVCKTLHLQSYPDKADDISKFFKTHKFDPLLILSGLQDTFNTGAPIAVWQSWSEFTGEYPGDWPAMRYNAPGLTWNEVKVKKMYTNLIDPVHGIITQIKLKRRW